MKIAYFDGDGICRFVSNRDDPAGDLGCASKALVQTDAHPREVFLKGGVVVASKPTSLELPATIDTDARFCLSLPPDTIADVDGERQTGELVIARKAPTSVHVELRGAEHGSFLVQVWSYSEYRRAEYPAIGDQLDALWKGLAGLIDAPADGNAAREMLNEILAVKGRHSKP